MNANAPRPAITMTATMIRTMYIFGSLRFGATGVISGPDGPEGPGSICDSVGCILGSSQLRRYRHFSYTSVLEHAFHSHARTRTFAHRIETTLAARERRSEAVLLRRIGCPTHRAEIDSRGRKCNAEAPNDEPGTYFRAGGGAAAQRIREAASRPLLRVRGHGQGAVRSRVLGLGPVSASAASTFVPRAGSGADSIRRRGGDRLGVRRDPFVSGTLATETPQDDRCDRGVRVAGQPTIRDVFSRSDHASAESPARFGTGTIRTRPGRGSSSPSRPRSIGFSTSRRLQSRRRNQPRPSR